MPDATKGAASAPPLHIHGDFETRSVVDIKTAGADLYAEHPSTEVLILSFAFGDDDVERWIPGDPLPQRLFDALAAGAILVAHNAYFELVIWNKVCVKRYGFPPLRPEQVIDTMAIAYAHSLPGSLDGCSKAIGLKVHKSDTGRRVMLKLCRPKGWTEDGEPIWIERADEPELFDILYEYCDNDVVVEREVEKKLPALKPSEQATWVLDFKINQRGVPIDVASVHAAKKVIEEETRALNTELRKLTNGFVPAATNPGKIIAWLRDVKGVEVHSLTKADVRELLDRDDLDKDARRVLEIRQQGGKTSVKKLDAMLACVSADGRARGLHQFHAASTGRWGGRRIQQQNMPRPVLKGGEIDWVFEMLARENAYQALDLMYGEITPPVSSCLRGMIATKPGRRFVVSDFSNVEGRVLPWLSGEEWKLDLFRAIDSGAGKDIYLVSASGIFGEEIDDKEDPRRQVGKVSELALGYQGGPGAYASMAANYAIVVEDILPVIWPVSSEERRETAIQSWESIGKARKVMSRDAWVAAELVKIPWREKHPMTVAYWRDIEDAAIAAVEQPGRITKVGRGISTIQFRMAGSFLFMRLPSGRCLAYPYPKLIWRKMPWKDRDGKAVCKIVLTYFSRIDESKKAKIVPDHYNSSKWARVATYGGELTENADQAVSRDLLRDALFRAEAAGYPIVMHVHDEGVAELPVGKGTLAELNEIMAVVPPWAAGLPMASAGWEGSRYRK